MMRKSLSAIASLLCFAPFLACTETHTEPAASTGSGRASTVTVFYMSPAAKLELVEKANKGDAEVAFQLANAWMFGDQKEGMGAYWYYRAAIAAKGDAVATIARETGGREVFAGGGVP